MIKKININQTVWKILKGDLAIQKDLHRKLINTRALAKYIIHKYDLNVSYDSVISAIRRFDIQEIFKEEEKSLLKVFKNSVVSTKSNIACVTLSLTPKEFFKKVCTINSNEFSFKFSSGNNEMKIVLNQIHTNKILSLFGKNNISKIAKDLGEITVNVSEVALKTPGVLAKISNELALANINIQEIIICPPEFLIYICGKDIVQAHESIIKLT